MHLIFYHITIIINIAIKSVYTALLFVYNKKCYLKKGYNNASN